MQNIDYTALYEQNEDFKRYGCESGAVAGNHTTRSVERGCEMLLPASCTRLRRK